MVGVIAAFSIVVLTSQAALSQSEKREHYWGAKDNVWGVKEVEGGGILASVNGMITHGDRHMIAVRGPRCNIGDELFTVYARRNKGVLYLRGKVVPIALNGKKIVAKVVHAWKFLFGYIGSMYIGSYELDRLPKHLNGGGYLEVKILDGENFKASDYFNILENRWSMKNFRGALTDARELCRKRRGPKVTPPAHEVGESMPGQRLASARQ